MGLTLPRYPSQPFDSYRCSTWNLVVDSLNIWFDSESACNESCFYQTTTSFESYLATWHGSG